MQNIEEIIINCIKIIRPWYQTTVSEVLEFVLVYEQSLFARVIVLMYLKEALYKTKKNKIGLTSTRGTKITIPPPPSKPEATHPATHQPHTNHITTPAHRLTDDTPP